MERLVSDIPAGDGKSANLFYSLIKTYIFLDNLIVEDYQLLSVLVEKLQIQSTPLCLQK